MSQEKRSPLWPLGSFGITSVLLVAGAFIVACFLAVACGGGAPKPQEPPPAPAPRIVEPVSYDGEIFHFPVTGYDYRESLAAFRKARPALRCQYFGADDYTYAQGNTFSYTHIVGHTIVCTDTAVNAQEETVP